MSALGDDRGGASSEVNRIAQVQAELTQRIVGLSRGRLQPADLDPVGRLLDRGWVDSITLVELLAFVEARWRVRVAETRLTGRLGTLAALAEHVVREGKPAHD